MNVMGRSARGALVALTIAGGAAACSSPASVSEAPVVAAGTAVAPKALEEATAHVFDDTEAHAERPPHGGVIVPLGAHLAHAELVAVPDTGELRLYLLDAEGQPGQRVAQPEVVLDVETSGRLLRLQMAAVPDEGVGERVGDASRFAVRSDDLLRVGEAKVTVKWIGVSGQVYSDVVMDWPPPTL
jgi:hypothetical protein